MVVGIDACPKGWVAVGIGGAETIVATGSELAALVGRFEDAEVIGIDMPIGFSDSVRKCDLDARRFVGPRRSSVFITPPEDILYAPTYEEANARSRAQHGGGISRQAYALAVNVRVVADLARGDARFIEVHPEVSFRALLEHDLDYRKNSWNGQALRRRALNHEGIELPELLTEAGGVPCADVLDAAIAAWTARRHAAGTARPLPESAPRGDRPVIWY